MILSPYQAIMLYFLYQNKYPMNLSNFKLSMYIAIAVLLCISASSATAQKGEVGLRLMPTFSSFDVNNPSGGTVEGEVTFGWGAGMLLAYNFTDNVGIQGEVIYNTLSQKYAENDPNHEIRLRYVNIPLLLSINTGKTKPVNFNFVIGPQIGVSAGSAVFTDNVNENDPHPVLAVKKGDLGVAYGAGLSFGLTPAQTFRLGVGFRGVYGLIDISDNNNALADDSYYLLDRSHIKTYSGYIGLSFLF
jgi:hypothetical protein